MVFCIIPAFTKKIDERKLSDFLQVAKESIKEDIENKKCIHSQAQENI